MKRFSEKAFIKSGVIDGLRNRIFSKSGKKYIFGYWAYEKNIYNFVFLPTTDKSGKGFLIQLYNQHCNNYTNTAKLIFSAFDGIQEA